MLSGLPLFTGESVPHILAAVLQTEPDRTRLPKNLHPRLELLLERCLKKKPRERYHSIADARIDIEDVLNDPAGTQAPNAEPGVASVRPVLPWVTAAVVFAAAIAGAIGWSLQPTPDAPLVNRFPYPVPEGQTFRNTGRRLMALSPDGRHFVYNTLEGFYLRSMGELEPRQIAGPRRRRDRRLFLRTGNPSLTGITNGWPSTVSASAGAHLS